MEIRIVPSCAIVANPLNTKQDRRGNEHSDVPDTLTGYS